MEILEMSVRAVALYPGLNRFIVKRTLEPTNQIERAYKEQVA